MKIKRTVGQYCVSDFKILFMQLKHGRFGNKKKMESIELKFRYFSFQKCKFYEICSKLKEFLVNIVIHILRFCSSNSPWNQKTDYCLGVERKGYSIISKCLTVLVLKKSMQLKTVHGLD